MPKIQLHSQEDIRQAIQHRGGELAAQLSDREIFLSSEFEKYATKLISFILRKRDLARIKILYQEESDITAYTDGRNITANTGNCLVQKAPTLEQRFQSAMGLLFHEASHMLFMDFDMTLTALNQIRAGKVYGSFGIEEDPKLKANEEELRDVLSTPYAKAVAIVYRNLWNYLCDGHDEATLKKFFPGFVSQCIDTMDGVQRSLSHTVEEHVEAGASNWDICSQMILDYCIFRSYKLSGNKEVEQPYLDMMAEIEPTLDKALSEDDSSYRWCWMNLLVLQVWPYLKDLFQSDPMENGSPEQGDDPDSGEGGSGNNSQGTNGSQLTPDELADLLQQFFDQMLQVRGVAQAPQNGSGSGVNIGSMTPCNLSLGRDTDIRSIARQICADIAAQRIQQELDDAQMEQIRNMNVPLIHAKTKLDLNRHHPPFQASYEESLEQVKPYLKSLIQSTRLLVDELNNDDTQKHRRFGPIVMAQDGYRPDGAYFAKRNVPADIPDMAISILVDASGSMAGPKLDYSKLAVILIERFANALQIPLMIASHNVQTRGRVNLDIYTDFVTTMPDNDRYALAGIEPSGCNRDGFPIRICAELLAKRPEQIKMLLVLSDGAPNDTGYSGEIAREDIRAIVKEFRRKGLLILGAAIDKDREVIESIYGDQFLSIDNMTSLPKTLVRIIRQKMT